MTTIGTFPFGAPGAARTCNLLISPLHGVLSMEIKSGAPAGIRTLNLLIRSQALCPLSYGGGLKSIILILT